MVIAYVALFILLLIDVRPKFLGANYNPEYLSYDTSLVIKGLFVVLVFFRHFRGYITLSDSVFDHLFVLLDSRSSQLIVTMFLFYSGFGIYERVKISDSYIKTFFRHRFFPTWLSFAICLCMFIVENYLLHKQYDFSTVLLSFTGWEDIGNSNWFMFITFALYLLFVLSFILPLKNKQMNLVVFSACSILLFFLLMKSRPHYWYNTLLCFSLGMIYSHNLEKINFALQKNAVYWASLLIVFALFSVSFLLIPTISPYFFIKALLFCLLVVLLCFKISLRKGPVFSFLGKRVFSVYILQRLVFNCLERTPLVQNKYAFFVITLFITLLIAFLYDTVFNQSKKILVKA